MKVKEIVGEAGIFGSLADRRPFPSTSIMAPTNIPTALDTHCDGPGLSASTTPWSRLYKRFRQFEGFGLDAPVSIRIPRSLPPRVDLHGQNVIISGANSGIGYEAAYIFALWGARVVLACRPNTPPYEKKPAEARLELLQRVRQAQKSGQAGFTGEKYISDDQIEVWDLDFSSFKSIQAFGEKWLAEGRTLDILCNNAGLASAKYIVTEDGFELTRKCAL